MQHSPETRRQVYPHVGGAVAIHRHASDADFGTARQHRLGHHVGAATFAGRAAGEQTRDGNKFFASGGVHVRIVGNGCFENGFLGAVAPINPKLVVLAGNAVVYDGQAHAPVEARHHLEFWRGGFNNLHFAAKAHIVAIFTAHLQDGVRTRSLVGKNRIVEPPRFFVF